MHEAGAPAPKPSGSVECVYCTEGDLMCPFPDWKADTCTVNSVFLCVQVENICVGMITDSPVAKINKWRNESSSPSSSHATGKQQTPGVAGYSCVAVVVPFFEFRESQSVIVVS